MEAFIGKFQYDWVEQRKAAGGCDWLTDLDGEEVKYYYTGTGWVYVFPGYPVWIGRTMKVTGGYMYQTIEMFRSDPDTWLGPAKTRGKAVGCLHAFL